MTTNRFDFQQLCMFRVKGKVLNVGCKEDPASLKALDPKRVTNLDILDYNEDTFKHSGVKTPIPVDVVHDATVTPWPFEDDEFDLVVFGDMLEDLPDDGCQIVLLDEARRVAKAVCITTPEDTPERDAHHQTTITEEKLKVWLEVTGWKAETFEVVDYGFVPRGYFVLARRALEHPLQQEV